MKQLFWQYVATVLARPRVATWLIERSLRTPYEHITSADGQQTYMSRWWLYEGYDQARQRPRLRWFPWSIRVHHICREDHGSDLHDHPWYARTIILRTWRGQGTSAALRPGEYHRIDQVSPGGVFTLFITSPKFCDWGFLVNGKKVPAPEYTGEQD